MAVDYNKFSLVLLGHIFEWNLMKLCMGPLFDMLYREKMVKFGPPDGPAGRKTGDLFSRFESLGVDLEKEFFTFKIMI